jgi:hypothetical protein
MIGVGEDIISQGRTTKNVVCKYESVKYIVLFPLPLHNTRIEWFKKIASDIIQIVHIFHIISEILFVLFLLSQ